MESSDAEGSAFICRNRKNSVTGSRSRSDSYSYSGLSVTLPKRSIRTFTGISSISLSCACIFNGFRGSINNISHFPHRKAIFLFTLLLDICYNEMEVSDIIVGNIFCRIFNRECCSYPYRIFIGRGIGCCYKGIIGFIRYEIGKGDVFPFLISFKLHRFWKFNMDQSIGWRFDFDYSA
jgi:hypothetical protein